MKILLNVPFDERDEAKKLGCMWDRSEKRGYIKDPENVELFMRWIPEYLRRPHKQSPSLRKS